MTQTGRCPRCQAENCCQVGPGSCRIERSGQCWCFKVDVTDALIEKLRRDYPGDACLCRACLEALALEDGASSSSF